VRRGQRAHVAEQSSGFPDEEGEAYR